MSEKIIDELRAIWSVVIVNCVVILGIIAQLVNNGVFSPSWHWTMLLLAVGYGILMYLPKIKKRGEKK